MKFSATESFLAFKLIDTASIRKYYN